MEGESSILRTATYEIVGAMFNLFTDVSTPPSSSFTFGSAKKNTLHGHPYRFSSKKSRDGSVSRLNQEVDKICRADSETYLLNGYVEIFCSSSETKIKKVLAKLFKTRLSLIFEKDYDFITRTGNVISKSTIQDNTDLDFDDFNILARLDKLCCRLNIEETCKIYDKDPDILSPLSVSTETSQYPTHSQSVGYTVQAVHQLQFLLPYEE